MNAGIENFVNEQSGELSPEMARNLGETNRDQVLKKEIVRRVLYAESGQLSVGQQLVGTESMTQKEVNFTYPGEMSAEYDVGPTSLDRRQRLEWNEFSMRLKRGHTRYYLSDDAKLDGMSDMQLRMTRRRSAEALARRKDENILGTLKDGAISENEDAESNGDEWNASGVDIVDKMWNMWQDILLNAPVSNMDAQEFALVVPAEIWTELNRLELINNIQQRVRDYVGQTFNFAIYPTKLGMHDDDEVDLRDTAIMLIPGSETAIHGVLSAETAASRGVPLVESEREFGRGEDYIISQWYNTGVFEHESGDADKSPRIAVRTNVNASV